MPALGREGDPVDEVFRKPAILNPRSCEYPFPERVIRAFARPAGARDVSALGGADAHGVLCTGAVDGIESARFAVAGLLAADPPSAVRRFRRMRGLWRSSEKGQAHRSGRGN
jgi:hypothetical protein